MFQVVLTYIEMLWFHERKKARIFKINFFPLNFPAVSYEAEFDNALDEKAGDSEEEPQP